MFEKLFTLFTCKPTRLACFIDLRARVYLLFTSRGAVMIRRRGLWRPVVRYGRIMATGRHAAVLGILLAEMSVVQTVVVMNKVGGCQEVVSARIVFYRLVLRQDFVERVRTPGLGRESDVVTVVPDASSSARMVTVFLVGRRPGENRWVLLDRFRRAVVRSSC